MSVILLHNPRCSKSRQTLALLNERGVEPEIREYLKEPLNRSELETLLEQLDQPIESLIRKKEPEFKEAGLNKPGVDQNDLLDAIERFPKLMERPVVIAGGKARIGRPPEQVLEIL